MAIARGTDAWKERAQQYHRDWYPDNRERLMLLRQERRAKKAEYLREQKDRPCMDCGGSYPSYVMDFDHRPGETKLFKPTALPKSTSWEKIKAEVAKCDVVCANCHRIRTHERLSLLDSDPIELI